MEQSKSRSVRVQPSMTDAEAELVLKGFNDTAVDYPSTRLIHELFETHADRSPEAIALIFENQRLTYRELNRRANRVAHELLARGLRSDSCVGVYADRGVEMIVGMLAALKAGGAYVPLDPAYPADRLLYMSNDASLTAILTTTDRCVEVPTRKLPIILLDDENLQNSEDNPRASGLTSRNLAYVIYTSGSSGSPKGVMIEHRSVLRLVVNSTFAEVLANDCIVHCASPSFDAATWEVWGALLNGARVLIVPQCAVLSPVLFNETLTEHRASAMFLTAGLFHKYVDQLEEAFSGLRHLLVGGDVVVPAIAARALSKASPPKHLLNAYGPTETTTFATTFTITRQAALSDSLPIGRPITNTQVYILDAEQMPVSVGVVGDIYIGGPGVARGYMNQVELTRERFILDPFNSDTGEKLYRTGDLGRWTANGDIEFLGRVDFQVKIRGFRIEPAEVETALQRHPSVQHAIVLAREDEPGDKRLVAYVVTREGRQSAQADRDANHNQGIGAILRDFLAQTLPSYLMPSAIVVLDEFPLTSNGKVDRNALPAPHVEQRTDQEHTTPRTPLELILREVWMEVLKLGSIGIDENFFELGGDSIRGLELMAVIGERIGIEGLSVIAIFEYPTIREMAQFLETPTDVEEADSLERPLPPPDTQLSAQR